MEQQTILECGTIKLNSFRPLCWTNYGNNAIDKYGLPPFIDGSCRREPDFQNPFPSISALCRQGKFAPHLKTNDIVVYMTVGGRQLPYKFGHHLVAILQVEEVFNSHKVGGEYYNNCSLPIPSNCMIDGNSPCEFEKTFGNFENFSKYREFTRKVSLDQKLEGIERIVEWDNCYKWKSELWPIFVKTRPLYLEIYNPLLLDDKIVDIFQKMPNTRTPKKITQLQLIKLAKLVGVDINME